MKTISLRKFRDSIPDHTEPVAVVRRNPDGTITALGMWDPNRNGRPEVVGGYVGGVPEAARPFTPVPKPSKRGRT